MNKRLTVVALFVSLICGCGGPSGEPARQTTAEPSDQDTTDLPTVDPSLPPNVPSHSRPQAAAAPQPEPVANPNSPYRKWTDRAGSLLAVAEFISLQSGTVGLLTEDGGAMAVAFNKLSKADQDYVNSQGGGNLDQPVEKEQVAEALNPRDEMATLHPSGPIGGTLLAAGQTAQANLPRGREKVIIPFDFVSNFDDGDYGRRVGEGIWVRLDKEGLAIIPDSMYDVRDLCKANGVKLGPDTPLGEVRRVVTGLFGADVGIWGSVERVPGHEWDVYDVVMKCVDFTTAEPKVIYDRKGRTQVVSEIPHVYREEMLDALFGREPGAPEPLNPVAEENWRRNRNLVIGDFERGADGVPAGWAAVGGQQREPLGGLVSWAPEHGNPDNKVIRFTFDKGVGNSSGVTYYSDWFPVQEGAKYRFQCRYRTNGPKIIVFIKCYSEMGSEYQANRNEGPEGPGGTRLAASAYLPQEAQRRECYRSQQNLGGPKNVWNEHTQDFTPRHTKYVPRWGRVDLYSYLGGGVVEFDDVVLKQILPPSPSDLKKDPRHSMESTITMKEIEENERRGREAAERIRQQSRGEN